MATGRVTLVGAGPGDPGLLTLRGREALAAADVVVYDALVSPHLLDHAPPGAERVYVGKRSAQHTLSQDGINALLVERARGGAAVVRLKGGDPYVFGRGGEEGLALAEAGIPFEIVPGITAAVAAAAYAGIPVTHRGLASTLTFVTGHEADDKADSAIDWAALARLKGTLAFYMGVANLPAIAANLMRHGLAGATPAAAVQWGTTPRHRSVAATLETLHDAVTRAGLGPPAILLVGEVVRLRESLGWFEQRPLLGRRIVVTRARAQASSLVARLEALGAETIEAPAIRIEPPDDPAPLAEAARAAGDFDWIVFTSTNGVDAFFAALAAAGLDARRLAGCRVAAIGPATAERLAACGIRA
ncbi:MAG: uroporphyrinogen-III C-methyltransferase, partial [Planctomycetes bacterium]|nr:uroporphyrinogen-III C-methyltransferase [Planctomycetota bacterium]